MPYLHFQHFFSLFLFLFAIFPLISSLTLPLFSLGILTRMNLSKFLSTIIIVLLTAASTTAAAARQRRHEGQDTCKAKYSIGGTADLVIADGTLLYPDSKDQCHYGVQLLAEGATDIRIKCCVKKTCGKDLVGVCQDKHKNCKGSIVVYVFQKFWGLFVKKEDKHIYIYIHKYTDVSPVEGRRVRWEDSEFMGRACSERRPTWRLKSKTLVLLLVNAAYPIAKRLFTFPRLPPPSSSSPSFHCDNEETPFRPPPCFSSSLPFPPKFRQRNRD